MLDVPPPVLMGIVSVMPSSVPVVLCVEPPPVISMTEEVLPAVNVLSVEAWDGLVPVTAGEEEEEPVMSGI